MEQNNSHSVKISVNLGIYAKLMRIFKIKKLEVGAQN